MYLSSRQFFMNKSFFKVTAVILSTVLLFGAYLSPISTFAATKKLHQSHIDIFQAPTNAILLLIQMKSANIML